MVKQAIISGTEDDASPDPTGVSRAWPIRTCVREALDTYFHQLEGYKCSGLYKMVLTEVEMPLLEVVMRVCSGNQTKAAEMLGINRSTLRKKLQHYGLDH